jgi:hypothetical protein
MGALHEAGNFEENDDQNSGKAKVWGERGGLLD